MKRLQLRDGKLLAYDGVGAGPPLLLVHGFTGSRRAWPRDVIAALAAQHRVLIPDLIGHGESHREQDAARFAIDEIVADLCELLDACGVRAATWIGYSMGGRISLAAAVLQPAHVTALVLEGASPGLQSAEERATRRAADAELARSLESAGIEPFVERWLSQPLFDTQKRLPESSREAQRALRLGQDPRALAACLRGLGTGSQPSFWKDLTALRAPTLLIAGAEDAKFTAIATQMQQAIPDARQVRIDAAGHCTHLEQPAAYLDACLAFIDDLDTRDRRDG